MFTHSNDPKKRDDYLTIYRERFHSLSAYKLPFFTKDAAEPMQTFLILTPQIYQLTIQAYEKRTILDNLIDVLPEAAIKGHITNYILVEELMKTNEIEGVHSSRKDIETAINDLDKKSTKTIRFLNQVLQYNKILNKDFPQLKTPQDIRSLYDEFLSGEIDAKNLPDGATFRKESVSVYAPSGKELHKGLYPESAISAAIAALLDFINDDTVPILLKTAASHYYFGYIHPFYDGNGRISRLISSILLAEYFHPLLALRLSYTIHENLSNYYKAFELSNDPLNKGDITPFILMFLSVIGNALDELIDDLASKNQLLKNAGEKIYSLRELSREEQDTLFVMQQAKVFSNRSLTLNALLKNSALKQRKMKQTLALLEEKGLIYTDKSKRAYRYVLKLEI